MDSGITLLLWSALDSSPFDCDLSVIRPGRPGKENCKDILTREAVHEIENLKKNDFLPLFLNCLFKVDSIPVLCGLHMLTCNTLQQTESYFEP